MKEITRQDAIALLERAVQERGAYYVYEPEYGSCEYWSYASFDEDGEPVGDYAPSCMVGLALSYEGVGPDEYGDIAGPFNDQVALIGDHFEIDGLSLTAGAQEVFEIAQEWQDSKTPWGLAVEHAKNRRHRSPQ